MPGDRYEQLRHMMEAPSERVTIERQGDEWVISDEGGEFARCGSTADAVRYTSDLLYGPATAPRGTIWNLLRTVEESRSSPVSPDSPFGI